MRMLPEGFFESGSQACPDLIDAGNKLALLDTLDHSERPGTSGWMPEVSVAVLKET